MGGWRTKLIFLLVVYFAGFATAIYTLAPVPESRAGKSCEKSITLPAVKSDKFAQTFNVEFRKCLDVAKEATVQAGRYIKQKLDEKQLQARG